MNSRFLLNLLSDLGIAAAIVLMLVMVSKGCVP